MTTAAGGAGAPFDVFDVHHHVGRAFNALGGELAADDDEASADRLAEFARVELADRLRIMDEGGVHQALVIPGTATCAPRASPTPDA